MNRELWPHQTEALQALRQSIGQGVRRIILSAPTGSGKTVLSAAIVEGALAKGNRVCFVISNLSLVDQTVESFYSEGIRGMSVIQGDHEMLDWSKPVQIASIQTLRSRKAFPEAQVVIIDEVHVLHKCHIEWLQHPDWQKVPFIGLSATPYTKGLGKYFESLIVVATIQELIDKGVLCPFKVYATGHPNLDGVRVVAGDYVEKELSDAMQQGTLVADIIKTYKERWGKGKTLFYGVDRAHAQAVQKRFQEAGVKCGYQDALTPADERRELRRQFQNGEIEVLSNVSTLTTGTDVDCRCLILGRPTRSESLFQQIVGRGLRIAEGKDHLILLDHSDTTSRLGFVTDIFHDRLDDGKPKEKAPPKERLPKSCPQCDFMKKSAVCPNCGFKPEVGASGMIERDGELIELTSGLLPSKQKKGAKREWTMEEKAAFFGELKTYAQGHKYKEGWPAAKYKSRFSVWPNHPSIKNAPAIPVSMETTMWIKSENIRWAKSQGKKDQSGGAMSSSFGGRDPFGFSGDGFE
jgi:DNA repair protein RadD